MATLHIASVRDGVNKRRHLSVASKILGGGFCLVIVAELLPAGRQVVATCLAGYSFGFRLSKIDILGCTAELVLTMTLPKRPAHSADHTIARTELESAGFGQQLDEFDSCLS